MEELDVFPVLFLKSVISDRRRQFLSQLYSINSPYWCPHHIEEKLLLSLMCLFSERVLKKMGHEIVSKV